MLTLSNSLSFFRAPLALLFLQEKPLLRLVAILLAMLTDSIDGYLARRSQSASRFGAILDPTMDKFFVYFVLTTLCLEGRLHGIEAFFMLCRDFFVFLYGLFMTLFGRWHKLEFRAIRWGKVSTALQFFVLIGLTLQFVFPWPVYATFGLIGTLAFFELLQLHNPFSA